MYVARNFLVPLCRFSTARKPLIKFLGKRCLIPVIHQETKPVLKVESKPLAKKTGNGVDFFSLAGGAWFGRPKLSQEEIEAIQTGGASAF